MAHNDDTPRNTPSLFEEIEGKLEDALVKRKEDLQRELEERIRKEREETQRKIEELDRELKQEKGSLVNFQAQLGEFEKQKEDLKRQIKEHIDQAVKFQTDIETLTGQTLEELKKVSNLNQRLEELQSETGAKILALKKEMEEKFGFVAEVPEEQETGETEINLDYELAKLNKIKELLNSKGPVGEELPEMMMQEPAAEEGEEQPQEEAREQQEYEEKREEGEEEAGAGEAEEEKKEEAPVAEEAEEAEKAEEPAEAPEEEAEPAVTEEKPEEKAEEVPEAEPKAEGEDASFQSAFEKLEEFRKGSTNESEGEVSYFEKDDKIVLDGEYIVSSLNNSFEEAKKLYIKLSQTESPKDQFFIKQEIIKLQEALRKVLLRSIRMCEKDNCALPEYTSGVLDLDRLKDALEKVSMQNWSNQDDFAAFDNFAKELKDSFYSRITPPSDYLKSILKELDIS